MTTDAMSRKKNLSAEQRRALLATPAGWLACGFGSGLAPVAQGTFGSLAALLPWIWLRQLSLPAYATVLVVGFVVGVWACNVAGRSLGVADHRSVVWDEFIGQWIALLPLLVPACLPATGFAWWMPVPGFALFRLFDVRKPWPISWLDRHLKGGMGVMVDDVVAGVFAGAVLTLGLFYLG